MNLYRYIAVIVRDEFHAFFKFLKESIFIVLALVALILAAVTISLFIDSKIYITTSYAGSNWYTYALNVKSSLEKNGLEVAVLASDGSIDNVDKLIKESDKVNVGFTYGGALTKEEAAGIYSLGSVNYEPIWVFYRKDATGTLSSFRDLQNFKVGIDSKLSGTYRITEKLLKANGVEVEGNPHFRTGDIKQQHQEFLKGDLDAFVRIASNDDPMILELLKNPNVTLFEFQDSEAYEKNFSFIKAVVLPKSSLDLLNEVPKQNIKLIATSTSLVIRKNLDADLQLVLLMVARDFISSSTKLFFIQRGELPAYIDPLIPLSPTARNYYVYGPPSISRHFSYKTAALIDRVWPFLLIFFAIAYPLSQISFRFRRLRSSIDSYPHYRELLKIEEGMNNGPLSEERRQQYLKTLDNMRHTFLESEVPSGEELKHFSFLEALELLRGRLTQD